MDGGRSPGPGLGSRWRRAEGGGRLIGRDRVRTALAVALSGALVLTVLAWLVDGDKNGDRVDDVVERAIDTVLPMGRGLSRALGEFVADLGSPVSTTLFMIAAALFAHLRCGPRALALVLVGPPVAMILQSTVLKPIIGRTRGEELAFPSGHTTSVTSIAVAMAVIVLSIPLARTLRRWLLATFVVVPFAVAVCLVGRQYHYATDTVGAVGLALAVVLSAAVLIDAMADSLAEDPREIGPGGPAGPGPGGPGDPSPVPGAAVGHGFPAGRVDRPVGAPRGVGPTGFLPPPGRPPVPVGPPPSADPTERLPSLAAIATPAGPPETAEPEVPEAEVPAAEAPVSAAPADESSASPGGGVVAAPPVDDTGAEADADPTAASEPTVVEDEPAAAAEPTVVEEDESVAAEAVAAEDETTAAEDETTASEDEPVTAEPVTAEPVELSPAELAPVTSEPSEPEPARPGLVALGPAVVEPEPATAEPEPVTADPAASEAAEVDADVPATDVPDADPDATGADEAEESPTEPSTAPRPARVGVPPPRRTRSDRQRSLTLRRPAGQRPGT